MPLSILFILCAPNLITTYTTPPLNHGLRHGRDDALLDNDPRLRRPLERLLGAPLGSDRQPQRTLVLLLALEGKRQLRGEVLVVLVGMSVSISREFSTYQDIPS